MNIGQYNISVSRRYRQKPDETVMFGRHTLFRHCINYNNTIYAGDYMQQFIVEVMNSFGYIGIFVLILVENLFPPIPSEVILTFGGFMTTYTAMNVPGVIAASTAGSVFGAVILYYAGRLIPKDMLKNMLEGKIGKRLHFEQEDVQDAEGWFDTKGKSTVFFCRCVPIIRSLISIPAGMAGMKMAPFLILTFAGSLVWNTVLVTAGAVAGASWGKILGVLDTYSNITVIVVGIAALIGSTIYFGRRKGEEQ